MLLRPRRKQADSQINTEGWMMSYADMATILLAMFIVLSTLGKDQTGVNLYNGTGSFRKALDSFGLPGIFPTSARPIQMNYPSPHYSLESSGDQPGRGQSSGTGEEGLPARTIDAEQEQMQRFLQEVGRRFPVEKVPRAQGQAVVDFYDRLNKSPPYLAPNQSAVIGQTVPILRGSNFRVFVVVWAPTPGDKAWVRAAKQAQLVAQEIADTAQLDAKARERLVPLGQPWRYRDFQRPIMSLIIVKTESVAAKR
jgi:hypothetical protein